MADRLSKLSWRGIILHVARWPIVFWALINVVFRRLKHPYLDRQGQTTSEPTFPLIGQARIWVLAKFPNRRYHNWSFLRSTAIRSQGYALFALAGASLDAGPSS